MKRSAATTSGPASHQVAIPRRLTISIKRGCQAKRRATFHDIHNVLFWLYSLQQRHRHPDSETSPESKKEEPSKPSWLTVQNGQYVGTVLVVIVPYLDAELLRVYANTDPRVVVASSQLSKEALQEFFGLIDETSVGHGYQSILKTVAANKIPMRPPLIASPPYCSVVQNFFSVATSSRHFRGVPIGDSVGVPVTSGLVRLSHYILTPEELHERGFPGFERGTRAEVPDGYSILDDTHFNSDDEGLSQSLMYGVDCEMVDTAAGKEVGRVCVVDSSCKVILDVLVKPSGPVVDYLTQFSGLTEEILDEATLYLNDVKDLLRKRLPPGAILVGHSLEYDLRALRLVHRRCIDTTVLYPHSRKGLKLSLKRLAQLYLKKNMQRVCGHDPREDAQAAMLLALKKIENGPAFGVPMTQLVPLAPVMRKLQRDPRGVVADESNESLRETAAAATPAASADEKDRGFMFLVDSFKYDSTSSLQDVCLKDGLSDDGAVVRFCKDFLHDPGSGTSAVGPSSPSAVASSMRPAKPGCKRRWGICVLRAYQRLCSRALQAPTNRLYAFSHRTRKLLTAEEHLRRKLEVEKPVFPACRNTPFRGNTSGFTSVTSVPKGLDKEGCCDNCLEDSTISCCIRQDGKGLVRDIKALFPPVCRADAMRVVERIDHLLAELFDSLQPQDVMILLSPCGDAYRYFSMRSMQSVLKGDESADFANPESQAGSSMQENDNPFVPFVPLEWTMELERELEKAKNTFEGPTSGGWCSILVRQPD